MKLRDMVEDHGIYGTTNYRRRIRGKTRWHSFWYGLRQKRAWLKDTFFWVLGS